jgi:hypothetical protein
MKKISMLLILSAIFIAGSFAQSALQLPIAVKNEDGGSSFFDIKQGDKLVYAVNAGGRQYEFIVTVNKHDSKNGIDFNYEMTNATNTSGRVMISPAAMAGATKYVNYFRGGELSLTDASSVWLSGKNFGDMPQRQTSIQLDNGAPETFYRPKDEDVSMTVKIKGENKIVTGFRINNQQDGAGGKTLWINDLSSNPLILKMDLGWTVTLKEIR